MTEPELAGQEIDPDVTFNEGFETAYDIAAQETQDEIMEQLEDQGFDQDEIEALFDPAPRRHRRRHHRRHAMSYDPAPRRRKAHRARHKVGRKGRSRRGKGALKGVLQYAGVIAGGAKFLMDYNARAKALGTDPTTAKPYNILSAIQYDIKNFDSAAAMTRAQTALPTVIGEGIAGYLAQTNAANKMLKGYGKPVGDVLFGLAGATLIKAILDPPVPSVNNQYRQSMQQQLAAQQQTQTQTPAYLPYGGF